MTEREFVASLTTPADGRRFAVDTARDLLDDVTPALLDDVALVVSELVTNAVRAGSPTVGLSVDVMTAGSAVVGLHIRVTDRAGGWPHPQQAGSADPGGRGLALVSALATRWGAQLDAGTKTVWAELTVPTAAKRA